MKNKPAILQKAPVKNWYAVLGVPPGIGREDLRLWFLQLSKDNHPDTGGDTARFAEITEAYGVLKDARSRKRYDDELRLLGRQCKTCAGRGLVNRSQGFLKRSEHRCVMCGGTGQEPPNKENEL